MPARQAIVALLLGVVVVVPACSSDNTLPTVAQVSTTTDPKAAADILPAPTPLPSAAIVTGLEQAVEQADFCAVLTAIDAAEPAASDRPGVIRVYRALATATRASRTFLPKDSPDLRSDWEVVVTGTATAADAAEAHDGDISDPEVEAALESNAMVDAIQTVERYQLQHCPPPAAPK